MKRAKAIEAAFDTAAVGVGVAFGAIATAGAVAFAVISKGLDEAAKFQDLAEETGAAAEDLASFAVAAATAGVGMDSIASASIKLTKGLTGVDDESKAAGSAIAALGLNIADFKKLDPAAQYEAVGKALAGFADGAGKTAVAVALFGKAGAEQLKVFKALEEQGGRTTILTQEQIAQADAFRDAQAKLTAELGLYASAIATQFVGPMNELIRITIEAARGILGLSGDVKTLGSSTGVRDFAQGAAVAITYLIENVSNAVAAIGTLGRAAQLIGTNVRLAAETASYVVSGGLVGTKGIKEAYDNNQDAFEKLSSSFKGTIDRAKVSEGKKLRELFDQQNRVASDPETLRLLARSRAAQIAKPTLAFEGPTRKAGGGGKGGADDPTKKLLDNDLKAFKAQGDQAKELLSDRNKILDLYNSQGLISVKDYYDALRGNAEEATAAQRKALDEQIKALQDFQAKTPKATDKADAQGKINDLLTQQAKLERESGNAAIEMGVKQQQATQAYRDSLNEVNAKILELDGNLGKAAEIRFDAQNRSLRALAEASGDFASVAQIDRLREYTKAQADLNAVQAKFSLAQGDLSIAEERITQARERGTMGEIQGLQASGKARQEAVALMQQQLEKFQAIDVASRTPEQQQAIERLKLQLEGLKATIDPLADRINTMFSDAAGNAFGDFITGAKSAKDAFKDFSKTIFNDLARMAAKDFAKSLFGGGGDATGGFGINIGAAFSKLIGGGSIGDSFSSLFGGGSKGTDRGASATNPLYVRSADVLGSSALTGSNGGGGLMGQLFGGAASLFGGFSNSTATSMANLSGGGLDDLLKYTKNFQGFTSGGFTGMGAANDPAGIVHKGEYVLDAAATRRLGVANLDRVSGGGGLGMNQTVNFSVQGQIDRRTETQLANKLRRETNTANARFK